MNTVFIIWTATMFLELTFLAMALSGRMPWVTKRLKWYITVDSGVRVAYFCLRYDANNPAWVALTYAYVVCYLAWLVLSVWPSKPREAKTKAATA